MAYNTYEMPGDEGSTIVPPHDRHGLRTISGDAKGTLVAKSGPGALNGAQLNSSLNRDQLWHQHLELATSPSPGKFSAQGLMDQLKALADEDGEVYHSRAFAVGEMTRSDNYHQAVSPYMHDETTG